MNKIKLVNNNVLIVLVGLFAFMRIYRNSVNYESTNQGGIWNIIAAFFALFAIIFIFNKIEIPKSAKYGIAYTFFSMLNVMMIDEFEFTVSYIYNFFMIGIFVFVYICFYYASLYNINTESTKKIVFVVFFAIAILNFIVNMRFRTSELDFIMVSNVYYLLCFLPFMLIYFKNTFLIFISYSLTGICILFSGKRAAFIAFVAFILVKMFFESITNEFVFKFLKNMFFILIAIALIAAFYDKFVSEFKIDIFKRLGNLKNDGGSGRDWMYEKLWNAIKESKNVNFLFGHGYSKTGEVLIRHSTAHCDFLEIFYDYGFAPFILLILFYISLIREGFYMLKYKYKYCPVYFGIVVASLILSLFSTYLITYGYCICSMAVIGTILGRFMKYKNEALKEGETEDEVNNRNNP